MSRRWVAAVGGAVTCVTAGAAGAAGGQLGDGGVWAWAALVVTLLAGGAATAWVALRTGTADDAGPAPETKPEQLIKIDFEVIQPALRSVAEVRDGDELVKCPTAPVATRLHIRDLAPGASFHLTQGCHDLVYTADIDMPGPLTFELQIEQRQTPCGLAVHAVSCAVRDPEEAPVPAVLAAVPR